MKKLYIKTFGCQMNEYDSGKMADLLHADEGMEMTNSPEDADVVLLNTCSIREKAEDKVFSDLGRLRELKKTKPNLLIGVGAPTPISKLGFVFFNSLRRPRSEKTLSSAFSRIEHVFRRTTSASSGELVISMPSSACKRSAILPESYSFIWQPKVLI